jgi:mono/diheme cytochrome c family protein
MLLIVLLGFGLTACGDGGSSAVDAVEGQEPYLRWCASCHGPAGEGRPPAFPPLAGSEWLQLPDEGLALIVLHGLRGTIEVAGRRYRGYMPPMQHLADDEIAAILRYTLTTWGARESSLDAAGIARLRTAAEDQSGPLVGLEGVEAAIGRLP